jgi:hypothetical protein
MEGLTVLLKISEEYVFWGDHANKEKAGKF